ncbi:MAG: O-antigen ligase [Aquabacterium sp.]|nr:O-antigen ligase [Aquabacterium sp.]
MLLTTTVLLLLTLVASRRRKGPLWALSIIWLVSLVPIATGAVRFNYFANFDLAYEATLAAFLSCFILGVFWHDKVVPLSRLQPARTPDVERVAARPWARFGWWAASLGTACLCIDYIQLDGAGLDDLAALRDLYISKEASVFARLGSVLSWGCLYCFAYALMFREVLKRRQFALYLLPVVGYFLMALFSAGRQAAMQILIFALLTLALKRTQDALRPRVRAKRHGSPLLMALIISAAMVGYMGYVAGARNDANISADKSEVLAQLFDFTLAPSVDAVLRAAGPGVRTTFVEGVIYFSSPVPLFSRFLQADPSSPSWGAMTFPFVLRQLEPLTGISVIGALEAKIEMMRNMDVIGAGWTTAISAYLQDFGIFGAGLFLFLQGYYSAWAWRRAREGTNFHHAVIALLVLTSAIYMPLVPAVSDTNIFLMWLYCLLALYWQGRQMTMGNQAKSLAVTATKKATTVTPLTPPLP